MPDRRRHRGPHPDDERLFAAAQWPRLRAAVAHLSWLLSHDYVVNSSLKLVGDRFDLDARQRLAIRRAACSDAARETRSARRCHAEALRGRVVDVDGFNVLTTVEAALAGGVLIRGRDGCLRDMASMHGSYRRVDETIPALEAIGTVLADLCPSRCVWWLDRPVSNSGRLGQVVLDLAHRRGWPWHIKLISDPDRVLRASRHVVVTADSVILDVCQQWFDLASLVVAKVATEARIVPLRD